MIQSNKTVANLCLVSEFICRLFAPMILLYGFYIQFHGDYSPGGGFQSGAIISYFFGSYFLLFDKEKINKEFNIDFFNIFLKMLCISPMLFLAVGFFSIFQGETFLDYSVIVAGDLKLAQHIGIFLVELGVGGTVLSALCLLLYIFSYR